MKKIDKENNAEDFVSFMMRAVEREKEIIHSFCRADNPRLEYKSWKYLVKFNVALNNPHERLPYLHIGSAIAKSKIKINGTNNIGKVLASCYDDASNNLTAQAKLNRLLSCESVQEVCLILRQLFSLIRTSSEISNDINFIQILKDLLNFRWENSRKIIKSQWAQDFFYSEKAQ